MYIYIYECNLYTHIYVYAYTFTNTGLSILLVSLLLLASCHPKFQPLRLSRLHAPRRDSLEEKQTKKTVSQDGPKTAQNSLRTAPSRSQDRPRRARDSPRRSKTAPKRPSVAILAQGQAPPGPSAPAARGRSLSVFDCPRRHAHIKPAPCCCQG